MIKAHSSSEIRPGFICVGMQRAATRWLYDQLRQHPLIWLPPHKELHYFDLGLRTERLMRKLDKKIRLYASNHGVDKADIEFLRKATISEGALCLQKEKKLYDNKEWSQYESNIDIPADNYAEKLYLKPEYIKLYCSLFENNSDLISGDITPAYSSLEESYIKAICEKLPNTKIILILRHPVERLISALSLWVNKGTLSPFIFTHYDELIAKVNLSVATLKRSYPSRIYTYWKRYAGERLITVFFDDIKVDPLNVLREIEKRLEMSVYGDFDCPAYNKKSREKKFKVPQKTYVDLYDYFLEEIELCREIIPGAASRWTSTYRK